MLVENQSQLDQVIRCLTSAEKAVVIDTETNMTKNPASRYCMGIAICADGETSYLPVGHKSWLTEAVNLDLPSDLFSSVTAPVVMHNAKFDLQVLRSVGLEVPTDNLWDTMVMAHLLDENEFVGLDKLAERLLGVKKDVKLAKVMKDEWDNMPAFAMARYAEQDALVTYELYFELMKSFEQFITVWEVDRQFLLVLAKMETAGLLIDREKAVDLRQQCLIRAAEIREQLGFDPAKPSQLHPKLFDSPPFGLGLKPASLTPTGKPQVNDDYLQTVNHPTAGLVLEYRGLMKEASTYYGPYYDLSSEDGRLHPNFKQTGTVTGRLSCENPNLQQVPRESRVKDLFLPEDGYQLWEIDFRNIEYRLAALYTGDERLISIFRDERDYHGEVAKSLGIERQQAKTLNFLILYGGGAKRLAEFLHIPVSEAYRIIDNYKKEYPSVFKVLVAAEQTATQTGSIKLWSGRFRRFKFKGDARKAFNALVQGGAFEIVKRSMIKLDEAGFDIRNQVHDSVWINVKTEAEVDEACKIMSEWTVDYFDVKFSVDRKRLN
jgi:DNA polymerase-1